MKKSILILFALLAVCLVSQPLTAQGKKTILLIRHAEKDVTATADPDNPTLTPAGSERAARLAKKLRRYKVGAVYSTNTRRTLDTAGPTAQSRRLTVQTYDAKNFDELINRIMKSKTKRFLIVGHSNTIPELANRFVNKDIFSDLDDEEYGVIWLIKLKNGKAVKTQIITY